MISFFVESIGPRIYFMKNTVLAIGFILGLGFLVSEFYLKSDQCLGSSGEEVWVPASEFVMGDDKTYPEEAPAHRVRIDGFYIDAHEVTNKQFRKFVEETGHVTLAEKSPPPIKGAPPEMSLPGSIVFTAPKSAEAPRKWWSYVPGANWRRPEGPGSSIEGKENYPVVHIAFEDALAYAKWAGRSLPTEAQFELAARSAKDQETFAWGGDEVAPKGEHLANTWQGLFPLKDTGEDGFRGIAPVGCFRPNSYKAYDLIGNVWEWTANWYAPYHDPNDDMNPKGPSEKNSYDARNPGFPVKVLKGGSFLCAKDFCVRYRPAARHAQDTGLGTSHIGFRTVRNIKKK